MKLGLSTLLASFCFVLVCGFATQSFADSESYSVHSSAESTFHVGFNQAHTFKGVICKKALADSACQGFDLNSTDIRIFYPNLMNEVTEQVSFSSVTDGVTYSLEIADTGSDPNAELIFVFGNLGQDSPKLLKLVDKFKRREHYIQTRLDAMKKAGGYGDEHFNFLEDLLTEVKVRQKQIASDLASIDEVKAVSSQSLQFENVDSYPAFKSHSADGLTITLHSNHGTLIQGQDLRGKIELQNSMDYSRGPASGIPITLQYGLRSGEMIAHEVPDLAFGETYSIEFNLGQAVTPGQETIQVSLSYESTSGQLAAAIDFDHNISVTQDATAPSWKGQFYPLEGISYVKNLENISGEIIDQFGRLDVSDIELQINSADWSELLQPTGDNKPGQLAFEAKPPTLPEGTNTLEVLAKDRAGNVVDGGAIVRNFVVDRTPPIVTLSAKDGALTNVSSLEVAYSASDASPFNVAVLINGIAARSHSNQTGSSSFSEVIYLTEGVNELTVEARDRAGNVSVSDPVKITLDTTPPVLSNILPALDSTVTSYAFELSGDSNEPLASIDCGEDLPLDVSSDGLRFSGSYAAEDDGETSIELVAKDLAGNTSKISLKYNLSVEPLLMNLITFIFLDSGEVMIVGQPGAVEPGREVTVKTGWFSETKVTASKDGSFKVKVDGDSNVTLKVTGRSGRTATHDLPLDKNTSIAGVVRDSVTNRPLKGVQVSVMGSLFPPVETDGHGVFKLTMIPTGDQTLWINGEAMPQSLRGKKKFYFSTYLPVNIGVGQHNVLQDEIYLTPQVRDGRETQILARKVPGEEIAVTSKLSGSSGKASVSISSKVIDPGDGDQTVTDPNAPGVSLLVPGNSATFPGQSKPGVGTITITEIPGTNTSVPTLSSAKPDTVISIQPEGTTFSEPVPVTLPNVNNFQPDSQVVILSKNSEMGAWEIDGVAKVTADGVSIVTEPGQGITKLSDIYAAPLGPTVKQLGAKDQPGANSFDGAMTTSIELPSFKSLGQDVTPRLIYNSSWAHPTVDVTNIFDVPRSEVSLLDENYVRVGDVFVEVTDRVTSWVEPSIIHTWFTVENVTAGPYYLQGIPNQSVISYSADASTLESGYHPYIAKFQLHLDQMVVGTRDVVVVTGPAAGTRIDSSNIDQRRRIDQIFPSDFVGSIFTLNKVNSEVGRGWRIAAAERLHGIEKDRITLEEADGSLRTYSVDNRIETVFDASPHPNLNLYAGVAMNMWPSVAVVEETGRDGVDKYINKIDLSQPTPTPSRLGGQLIKSNLNYYRPEFCAIGSYAGAQAGQGQDVKRFAIYESILQQNKSVNRMIWIDPNTVEYASHIEHSISRHSTSGSQWLRLYRRNMYPDMFFNSVIGPNWGKRSIGGSLFHLRKLI